MPPEEGGGGPEVRGDLNQLPGAPSSRQIPRCQGASVLGAAAPLFWPSCALQLLLSPNLRYIFYACPFVNLLRPTSQGFSWPGPRF